MGAYSEKEIFICNDSEGLAVPSDFDGNKYRAQAESIGMSE